MGFLEETARERRLRQQERELDAQRKRNENKGILRRGGEAIKAASKKTKGAVQKFKERQEEKRKYRESPAGRKEAKEREARAKRMMSLLGKVGGGGSSGGRRRKHRAPAKRSKPAKKSAPKRKRRSSGSGLSSSPPPWRW